MASDGADVTCWRLFQIIGSNEIGSSSAIVWCCCCRAPGHRDCPIASFRPSDQRQRRPNDRKCWSGNVVRSGDVEWLTIDDINWEGLTLVYSSRPGTLGPCSADSDALWLPVYSGYVLGRRASATSYAASVTSRGRTCVCQRRDAMQRSVHTAASKFLIPSPFPDIIGRRWPTSSCNTQRDLRLRC